MPENLGQAAGHRTERWEKKGLGSVPGPELPLHTPAGAQAAPAGDLPSFWWVGEGAGLGVAGKGDCASSFPWELQPATPLLSQGLGVWSWQAPGGPLAQAPSCSCPITPPGVRASSGEHAALLGHGEAPAFQFCMFLEGAKEQVHVFGEAPAGSPVAVPSQLGVSHPSFGLECLLAQGP